MSTVTHAEQGNRMRLILPFLEGNYADIHNLPLKICSASLLYISIS